MKRDLFTRSFALLLLLLCSAAPLSAQRFVADFRQVPLSQVLMAIDEHFDAVQVNFIFDELEDFTVTKYVDAATAHEAVMQAVGLYPMRVDVDAERIFVECYQKAARRLQGRVVDAEGLPMEFASIVLLAVQDSTYLAGGVSNENGDFVIPTDSAEVLLRVSYVGFRTYEQRCQVDKVVNVTLHPEQTTLGNVTIRGQRPLITREEELTVFHADVLEGAETMEAGDVLKYVPRVVVDMDGKVRIGQHEATIYVNDVKVSGDELQAFLRGLRGDDIERIEVQEVRGADEPADQKGGTLRIVTKQRLGLSGAFALFGLQSLQSPKYNYYPYVTAFFGTERWNLYAAAYHAQGNHYETSTMRNEYLLTGEVHDNLTRLYNLSKIPYLRLGGTYSIDRAKRHNIGAEVRIHVNHKRANDEDEMTYTDAEGNAFEGSGRQHIKDNTDLVSTALFYEWKLDERKSSLKVQAGYNLRTMNIDNDFLTVYPHLASRNFTEQDHARSHSDNFIARTDLRKSLPGGWGLRSGLYFNASVRKDEQHNVLTTTPSSGVGESSVLSDFRYREAITAAYAGVTRQFGEKVFSNLSLRMEHTHMSATDRMAGRREVERTYTDWMPYFFLSYTTSQRWAYSLAYTRSIYRPPFNLLTTYENRITEVMIDRGNPDLQPSMTDKVSLSAAFRQHTLTLEAWRVSDEVTEFFDIQSGMISHVYTNFGHRDCVSLEYGYSGRVVPWWLLNANAGVTWRAIPSSYNVRYHWSPYVTLVNQFSAKHIGAFEVEFESNGSTNSGNQYWRGQTFVHLAYSRRFLNDRLSVRFRFDDVFGTISNHSVNHVPTHTSTFDRRPSMQKVALTLTWSFGNRARVRREQVDESGTANDRL